jgi:hypothetical protein
MKTPTAFLGVALLTLAVAAPAAEIFRCTEPGGTISYQQEPCQGASSGQAVNIPSAYPDANTAERDRLLQREAALDARMLKRAEIDAVERIARDDRSAREREAQAERERLQNAPAYFVAWPARQPRHWSRHPWPAAIR